VLSGVIVGAAAWTISRWHTTLPSPVQAALFGFFLFFVLNFGYYFTLSESNNQAVPEAMKPFEGSAFQFHVMVLGQLPYISFLLAPVVAASIWAFEFARKRQRWQAGRLLKLNLAVLWTALVILIGIGIIYKAQDASSGSLEPAQIAKLSKANYQEVYLFLSDVRYVIFLSICHDLLIMLFLTLGLIVVIGKTDLYRLRNQLALGGILLIVLLAALPYYAGQQALVDQIVNAFGGPYTARAGLHEELLKARPLYPSSIDFRQLVSALSLGGAIVLTVNLPGLRFKSGSGAD
jgi:hypothetical protein